MSINNSPASRRDQATREACAAMPLDRLSQRMDIDSFLVSAIVVSPEYLRAVRRMRRELVSQSVRRSP